MNGKEIYQKISAKRDYSGSIEDRYAKHLKTLHFHMVNNDEVDKFYKLLEEADVDKKWIGLKEDQKNLINEYFFKDLFLTQDPSFLDTIQADIS